MRETRNNWTRVAIVVVGLVLVAGMSHAQPLPAGCTAPNNGSGTVTLPPAGCAYLNASQVHQIINGLPPGTTIILGPRHTDFICRKLGQCGTPGGSLGGERELFTSSGVFQLTGTGALAGWTRLISIPLDVETHTAPRPTGPVQSFKTNMHRIEGGIINDADFASLRIVGGTANGFPSPGNTTLTYDPDTGQFKVDSTFDVGFKIEFVGRDTGVLRGLSGTTQGQVKMQAFKK